MNAWLTPTKLNVQHEWSIITSNKVSLKVSTFRRYMSVKTLWLPEHYYVQDSSATRVHWIARTG